MFDEIDEGTAIFKVSGNPPNSKGSHFVDNDGIPSDHYLFLTEEASKILKRVAPLSAEMPKSKKTLKPDNQSLFIYF